jgi:hypothetical protein
MQQITLLNILTPMKLKNSPKPETKKPPRFLAKKEGFFSLLTIFCNF